MGREFTQSAALLPFLADNTWPFRILLAFVRNGRPWFFRFGKPFFARATDSPQLSGFLPLRATTHNGVAVQRDRHAIVLFV
jgi:hypothetical protein